MGARTLCHLLVCLLLRYFPKGHSCIYLSPRVKKHRFSVAMDSACKKKGTLSKWKHCKDKVLMGTAQIISQVSGHVPQCPFLSFHVRFHCFLFVFLVSKGIYRDWTDFPPFFPRGAFSPNGWLRTRKLRPGVRSLRHARLDADRWDPLKQPARFPGGAGFRPAFDGGTVGAAQSGDGYFPKRVRWDMQKYVLVPPFWDSL